MTKYKKRQIIVCSEDCPCHKGARYDQIECRCAWFCGQELKDVSPDSLLHEKYTLEELTG